MGGNAIRVAGRSICGRLKKNEYVRIKQFVLNILSQYIDCEIVAEMPGKSDFGDIDIMYMRRKNNCDSQIGHIRDFIIDTFFVPNMENRQITPKERNEMGKFIETNGTVTSFALDLVPHDICSVEKETNANLRYFQVDLIFISDIRNMEVSKFYFSYGDTGAILGRIIDRYCLRFGEIGLFCQYFGENNDPTCTIGKIELCRDPRKICEFFDFDYDYWLTEFPKFTQESDEKLIFQWIAKSRFFDPSMFEVLNVKHRRRQLNRPSYLRFMTFAGIEKVIPADAKHGEYGENVKKFPNRQDEAVTFFEKEVERDKLLFNIQLCSERQAKFSGRSLIDQFASIGVQLSEKDIGVHIARFKKICSGSNDAWNTFLDVHTKNDIDELLCIYVNS